MGRSHGASEDEIAVLNTNRHVCTIRSPQTEALFLINELLVSDYVISDATICEVCCGQDCQLLSSRTSSQHDHSSQHLLAIISLPLQLVIHLKSSSIYFNIYLFNFFAFILSLINHSSTMYPKHWKTLEYGNKRTNSVVKGHLVLCNNCSKRQCNKEQTGEANPNHGGGGEWEDTRLQDQIKRFPKGLT